MSKRESNEQPAEVKRPRYSDSESDSIPESLNMEDSINLDPFLNLPEKAFEQILIHISGKEILDLCLVSKKWKKRIDRSKTAMNRIFFNYNHESRHEFVKSSKKLQHVKVKQRFINYDSSFLSKILRFYSTLKSITFIGCFDEDSIRIFFEKLQRKESNPRLNWNLEDLCFVRSSENEEIEMNGFEKIFEQFSPFLMRHKLKSIKLCGIAAKTFPLIIPYLFCDELILSNMKLVEIGREIAEMANYNMSVKKLRLLMTEIDEETLKKIAESFQEIKTVSMTLLKWKSLGNLRRIISKWEFKVLSEKKNVDPLLMMPEELHDLVFQHLDFEEQKTISEVSRNWFNFSKKLIGASAMYNLESSHDRSREYTSVMMKLDNDLQTKINLVNNFGISEIKNLMFEIGDTSLVDTNSFFESCAFENLQYLRLASVGRNPMDDLNFSTCKNLQELHLDVFNFQSENPNQTEFVKYLKTAKTLEVLSFNDCTNLDNLFAEELLPAMPFKLKVLRLPIIKRFKMCRRNFNDFLMNHSKTLEELFLHQVDKPTIDNIFQNFHLKSFGFFEFQRIPARATCPTLQHLQLRFPTLEDILPYLNLAPNLESLHIYELNDDILRHIKQNFPKIKKILFGKNEIVTEHPGDIQLDCDFIEFEEFDLSKNADVHGDHY